jgi:hypothetical protein
VHLENVQAVLVPFRDADVERPLEPTGTQQRGVELRRQVRGAHHQHHLLFLAGAGFGVESVELDEQLHQASLALERRAVAVVVQRARASYGVHLVDEDDGRAHLSRALE